MNQDILGFFIGYLIAINLISISLVWLNVKTDIIRIKDSVMTAIFVILSIAGGVVGTLLGSEMLGYKTDSKVFKRLIPVLVFVEICVVLYAIYVK